MICGFPTETPEDFEVSNTDSKVNKKWSWTRNVLHFYAGPLAPYLARGTLARIVDRVDILSGWNVSQADLDFLREEFLPEKAALEALIDRSLDCWKY